MSDSDIQTLDLARARERMVQVQIARRGIRDSRVLDAMRCVPREAFVEPGFKEFAYEDGPQLDIVIAQPGKAPSRGFAQRGMRSIAYTRLAIWPITAAAYPDPAPISSTRSLGLNSAASIINATMYGCEIVWPSPIGSGPSS